MNTDETRTTVWLRLLFLLLILHPSSFILAVAPEDAAAIARGALTSLPPGEWNLKALLATRISPAKFIQPNTREFPKTPTAPQERHLSVQLRRGPEGSRWVIYRPSDPGDYGDGVRVQILKDGGVRLLELDGDGAISDANELLFGSAASYGDVALDFLSWPDQKFLGEETVRDRACWHIASHPPADNPGAYRRVESWIDREYRGLIQATAYDEKDRVVKEFRVRSFQEIEKVWMLKVFEITAPRTGARTRLEILDAEKAK